MNSIRTILFILVILVGPRLEGQRFSYELELDPIVIPTLGGLQSYAIGQFGEDWLIVGGRLDGLHQRQPFAAFDAAGNNTNIIVVNPTSKQTWKVPISGLPANIKEQLSSTNMQFIQEGTNLIITGGYAYSLTKNDHITFPYLTVIDLPNLISAVKEQKELQPHFKQIEDPKFAVTGGRIAKINSTYYLVGGHKFTGRYNPMGPTHGPGFEQEYTYEARPFTLDLAANPIMVNHLPALHDEMNLRRRDYNLIPQIRNGNEELMVFSGVFQPSANVPWLYPVSITEDGIEAYQDFTQHYNHYHCANIPIYHPDEDEMHNIFMGGIAQFYEENGILVQDNDVPFVKTIADVIRTSDGSFIEQKHTEEMPSLIGAGSEFILSQNAPVFPNGILDGSQIGIERTPIGYFYGGIKSSSPNIFWTNTGTQSEALSTIYKVSIKKKLINETNETTDIFSTLLIYPNPAMDNVRLAVKINQPKDIIIEIFDTSGILVKTEMIEKSTIKSGQNYLMLKKANVQYGAYLYKIKIGTEIVFRKVIWTE